MEGKLSLAQIIDATKIPPTGKVIFGTTVTLMNVAADEEVTYKIVGDDEADIKVNKISVYSPIARALVGKQVGDVAKVQTPNGVVEYELFDIKHI